MYYTAYEKRVSICNATSSPNRARNSGAWVEPGGK